MARSGSVLLGLGIFWGVSATAADLHVPGDHSTIQAAIAAAIDGDSIIVAPGVYNEPLNLQGKRINLVGSGGADMTILDGTGLNDAIVRCNAGETFETVIEGFTFTHGEGAPVPNCTTGSGSGGAIFIGNFSDLTVRDCDFFDNAIDRSLAVGGAIATVNGGLVAERCRFVNNGGYTASFFDGTSYGGAVYICNRAYETAATITDCHFIDNGPSSHGGAIWITMLGKFIIRGCYFSGNWASFGGGINLAISNNEHGIPGVGIVDDCEFVSNRSGFGGGLMARLGFDTGFPGPDPSLRVSNSRFFANAARNCCNVGIYSTGCFTDGAGQNQYYGGAADIRVNAGGIVDITNCLAARNTGSRAGGFHLSSCAGGNIRMSNCTVADNGTSGIHVRAGYLASGQAPSAIDVVNTISWSNGDEPADQVIVLVQPGPNVSASVSHCIVQGGFPGDGNIDADPQFVEPNADNYRIAGDSPAIDAGVNAAVPTDILLDLAAQPRFVDDPFTTDTGIGMPPIVDRGAYEYQACNPCDTNCDGSVNQFDIQSFIVAIQAHAGCSPCAADANRDGTTNTFDINAFINCLIP